MNDKNTASLSEHPVFSALALKEDLQCFMKHHVFAVWDFMSLIKSLQAAVAPPSVPWHPVGDPALRRFINELVLEEESDSTNQEGEFLSHFGLYLRAMREVGADTRLIQEFVEKRLQRVLNRHLRFVMPPKQRSNLPERRLDSLTRTIHTRWQPRLQ